MGVLDDILGRAAANPCSHRRGRLEKKHASRRVAAVVGHVMSRGLGGTTRASNYGAVRLNATQRV